MQGDQSIVTQTCEMLDLAGAAYSLHLHAPVWNMGDCAELDKAYSCTFCKNLFLTTRNGSALVILLIGAGKQFKTATVTRQLGVSRLSFGSEETLAALLHIGRGFVNPFALMFDSEHKIRLAIDRDLIGSERIAFHPNSNTATVVMNWDSLVKALDYMDVFPEYVTLEPQEAPFV